MVLSLWEPCGVGRSSRFDPFESLLADLFGQPVSRSTAGRNTTELVSDEAGYTLRFELPGVAKENIDISLDGGVLTVSADRKDREHYRRSYRLPEDVDDSKISAEHKDGVLEVVVARHAAPEVRAIPVA